MSEEQHDVELERVCKDMLDQLNDDLPWQWDGRFDTVMAELGDNLMDTVQSTLKKHFENIWDSSSIAAAPEIVLQLTESFSELMPGQLLFTSNPEMEAVVFCAWWPWGRGDRVSIRIATFYPGEAGVTKDEQIEKLRTWFGLG